MTLLPKPIKVARVPTPLRRNQKPLKRSGPIKRGKRPARVRKTPLGKLKSRADRIIGDRVRARGYCEAAHAPLKREEGCSNVLQWCHGFSRRYLATRWDERNGFCMCSAHHSYFTPRPSEWEQWLQQKMGMALYLTLQVKRGRITPMRAHELRALIAREVPELAEKEPEVRDMSLA